MDPLVLAVAASDRYSLNWVGESWANIAARPPSACGGHVWSRRIRLAGTASTAGEPIDRERVAKVTLKKLACRRSPVTAREGLLASTTGRAMARLGWPMRKRRTRVRALGPLQHLKLPQQRSLRSLPCSRSPRRCSSTCPSCASCACGRAAGAPVADIDEWLAALNACAHHDARAPHRCAGGRH